MSTNPNNAVGTNAAYSGRTSVNAFNDDLAAYTSGILSGWACVPSSGLVLTLGGVSGTRDVAIASNPAGNKTTINNISASPISVTISSPPVSNSRIDAIVAYVDNPPEGTSTVVDNPAACGLIAVQGTSAVSPVAPNDGAIRTAITADGASGSNAYYVVLALVTVASGTTDITSSEIEAGSTARISGSQIDFMALWPVGSYYETSDPSFDPNVSWGGTWVQDSKGRTTFAYDNSETDFDTVGKTGGSLKHSHSFVGLTNTNVTAGAGVIGTGDFTTERSSLPQYVVVIRWWQLP